jgi:ATP-dependent Lon protease
MYLLYPTEQDAWDRSEKEGIAQGLAYHTKGGGSRYVSAPKETIDGLWALDVTGYDLDELEESTVTPYVTFPQPTEDLM